MERKRNTVVFTETHTIHTAACIMSILTDPQDHRKDAFLISKFCTHGGSDDSPLETKEVNVNDLLTQPLDDRSQTLYTPSVSDQKDEAMLQQSKPWVKDANYFQNVHISSLALLKMAIHAHSGGSIEIMGMLTGKIVQNGIVVMDVYPLPVEGTETRVNAQAEGYEFMVQYLDSLRKSGRCENIVGWYHSHPGYGCWLSGIDVGTQSLNQQFQDPYLAIVVDPMRTITNGKVEIGAFRTYSEEYIKNNQSNSNANIGSTVSIGISASPTFSKDPKKTNPKLLKDIPLEKVKDFGMHSSKYYSLTVNIFRSNADHMILSNLWNKFWVTQIVGTNEIDEQRTRFEEFLNLTLDNLEQRSLVLSSNSKNNEMDMFDNYSTVRVPPQHRAPQRRVPFIQQTATSLRELAQQLQPTNLPSTLGGSQLSPFSRANWLAKVKEPLDTDDSDLDMNDFDSDSESRQDDDMGMRFAKVGSRDTGIGSTANAQSPLTPWGLSSAQSAQQLENAKKKEQNELVRSTAAEASRKLMNLKLQKMVFLNE